jgi:hypothetical protein
MLEDLIPGFICSHKFRVNVGQILAVTKPLTFLAEDPVGRCEQMWSVEAEA